MIDVNLNDQVLSTCDYLRPDTLNNNVLFSLVMASDLWTICSHPGDIHEILVNLVVDSCGALPEGGRITIETANLYLGYADILNGCADLIPGEYVLLSVSDTRSSSATALACLTSPLIKGQYSNHESTSIPRSICEIVRNSGGDIIIQNRQESGSTVRLIFPRSQNLLTTISAGFTHKPPAIGCTG